MIAKRSFCILRIQALTAHHRYLAIATIGGKESRVQFYLQDGPLRSPPPWVGALLQGVQHTLSSHNVELFYHIPEAEIFLPKDFGLQLIKLVRSNRPGRQGPLEKCCCPYGPLQLDTAAGIRVYCFWEYTVEDADFLTENAITEA